MTITFTKQEIIAILNDTAQSMIDETGIEIIIDDTAFIPEEGVTFTGSMLTDETNAWQQMTDRLNQRNHDEQH